jgi:hypothetical protein
MIFTPDHVLDIQQISIEYTKELNRKKELFYNNILHKDISSVQLSTATSYWVAKSTVLNILDLWNDNNMKSHVNMDNGELYYFFLCIIHLY